MRPIDADAFIRHISNIERFEDDDRLFTYDDVKKMIRDMPTIETQKHGTWINDDEHGKYICSSCGNGIWRGYWFEMPDFCPNCGSKNEIDEKDLFADYSKKVGDNNEK